MSGVEDDERDHSGENLPGITGNNYFLSPDAFQTPSERDAKTPRRVLSSHSLVGEDFVLSQRAPAEQPDTQSPPDTTTFPSEIALSPFTPSEGTQTPPMSFPDPVTPPRLNNSAASSIVSRTRTQQATAATASSSLPGKMRPPRVPQISLQPVRGVQPRHNRISSNSELSFLSALTDGTIDNHSQNTHSNMTVRSNFSVPRRRTVSWDHDETNPHGRGNSMDSPGSFTNISTHSTPASLLQPILAEEMGKPPKSIVTESRQERKAKKNTESHLSKGLHIVGSGSTGTTSTSSNSHPTSKLNGVSSPRRLSLEPLQAQVDHNSNKPLWHPMMMQDTGSFVATSVQSGGNSERMTPPSGQSGVFQPVPKRLAAAEPNLDPMERYSVDQVLESYPKEPQDEVLLMNKIESRKFSFSSLASFLLTNINFNEENMEVDEQDDTQVEEPAITAMASMSSFQSAKILMEYSLSAECTATTELSGGGSCRHLECANQGGRCVSTDVRNIWLENGGKTSGMEASNNQWDRKTQLGANIQGKLFKTRMKLRDDSLKLIDFLISHRSSIQSELWRSSRLIVLPSLSLAAVLFYVFGNPVVGSLQHDEDESKAPHTGVFREFGIASLSWWLLFMGVRQMFTYELARLSHLVFADFFTIKMKFCSRIVGPTFFLTIAHSRGWPLILVFWSLWNLTLNYGSGPFVHHWGYWQSYIALFNDANPHGNFASSELFLKSLLAALIVGVSVTVKRALAWHVTGKRLVKFYREDIGRLIEKMIAINEVSNLQSDMVRELRERGDGAVGIEESHEGVLRSLTDAELTPIAATNQNDSFDYSDAQSSYSKITKGLSAAEQLEIMVLLEAWEEPENVSQDSKLVTTGTILQFWRALEIISNDYPFSRNFGHVGSREECIRLAQILFERLSADLPGTFLSFETICLVAKQADGTLDRKKVKELIRVFRPSRDGRLSKIDFVKSVDSVYRSLRLFLASFHNSQQIDRACKHLVDGVFYPSLAVVVLAAIGVNIQALVFGVGSIIVSLAFMIGPASSKALEGILYILLRQPYDIGDRVCIGEVVEESNAKIEGNRSWIVEHVDLYTTTMRLGTTRELATFSNSSLANMRIVNLNRSDEPSINMHLKFSIDSTSHQRRLFMERITVYVKERPRQWVRVVDFRRARAESEIPFVEYVLVLQHRERWQNTGAILHSRGELYDYAVELQKELCIAYNSPYLPADMRGISPPFTSIEDLNFSDELKNEK